MRREKVQVQSFSLEQGRRKDCDGEENTLTRCFFDLAPARLPSLALPSRIKSAASSIGPRSSDDPPGVTIGYFCRCALAGKMTFQNEENQVGVLYLPL